MGGRLPAAVDRRPGADADHAPFLGGWFPGAEADPPPGGVRTVPAQGHWNGGAGPAAAQRSEVPT